MPTGVDIDVTTAETVPAPLQVAPDPLDARMRAILQRIGFDNAAINELQADTGQWGILRDYTICVENAARA